MYGLTRPPAALTVDVPVPGAAGNYMYMPPNALERAAENLPWLLGQWWFWLAVILAVPLAHGLGWLLGNDNTEWGSAPSRRPF